MYHFNDLAHCFNPFSLKSLKIYNEIVLTVIRLNRDMNNSLSAVRLPIRKPGPHNVRGPFIYPFMTLCYIYIFFYFSKRASECVMSRLGELLSLLGPNGRCLRSPQKDRDWWVWFVKFPRRQTTLYLPPQNLEFSVTERV